MKFLTAITATTLLTVGTAAMACPAGTSLVGGTGPNHKGGNCVAVHLKKKAPAAAVAKKDAGKVAEAAKSSTPATPAKPVTPAALAQAATAAPTPAVKATPATPAILAVKSTGASKPLASTAAPSKSAKPAMAPGMNMGAKPMTHTLPAKKA
jgi:hypothetical protein